MDILFKVLLGLAGIIFFTLFRSRKHFATWNPWKKPIKIKINNQWTLAVFLQENFGGWLWSLLVIIITGVVTYYYPSITGQVSDFIAVDLSRDGAFFGLGLALSGLLKK